MIPSLLLGIGNAGRAAARRAWREIERAAADRLPAVRVLSAGPGLAADEEPLPDGAEVLLTGTSANASFLAPGGDARTCIQATLDGLLSADNLALTPDVENQQCDVLLLASLEDPAAAALALPFAVALREVAAARYPGLSLYIVGLLMVPEGGCADDASLCATLDTLDAAQRTAPAPMNAAFLVSPVGAGAARLCGEDVAAMCAHYTAVHCGTRLQCWFRDQMREAGPEARVGAVGLSALEFDAPLLARELGLQSAYTLHKKGIAVPEVDAAKQARAAEAFARVHGLDDPRHKALTDELGSRPGGASRIPLEADLTIQEAEIHGLPSLAWYRALATFDIFFRKERFGNVCAAVAENETAATGRIVAAIRAEVDRIVESSRDPENAILFLKGLTAILERNRLQGRVTDAVEPGQAAPPSAADIRAGLDQLRQAAAKDPDAAPALLRAGLLTLILAVPLQSLLNEAARQQGNTLAWLTVPVQWGVALAIAGLPIFVSTGMTLLHARGLLLKVKSACHRLIHDHYVGQLNARVAKALGNLLATLEKVAGDPSLRKPDDDPGLGAPEQEVVAAFKSLLWEGVPEVIKASPAPRRTAWRLNASDYAPGPPAFAYHNNAAFDDWTGESCAMLQNGFLKAWRSATPAALADKVVEQSIRSGFGYLTEISLDRYLRENVLSGDGREARATRLYNDLHTVAAPRVALRAGDAPAWDPTVLSAEDTDGGPLMALVPAVKPAAMGSTHPGEMTLMRLMLGISVRDLLAWKVWESSRKAAPEAKP